MSSNKTEQNHQKYDAKAITSPRDAKFAIAGAPILFFSGSPAKTLAEQVVTATPLPPELSSIVAEYVYTPVRWQDLTPEEQTRKKETRDFSWCDFSDISPKEWFILLHLCNNHSSVRFIGARLPKANFADAHLPQANFHGAILTEAIFLQATLTGAHFQAADLRGAMLTLVDLTEANLEEANLEKADLSSAKLERAKLRVANLRKINGLSAILIAADVSGADLREANLTNASLQKADLTGALLEGADLLYAHLLPEQSAMLDPKADLSRVAWVKPEQPQPIISLPEDESDDEDKQVDRSPSPS